MSPRSRKIRTTLALTMALGAVAPAAGQAAQDLRAIAPTSSLAGTVDPQRQVVTGSAPSGFDWGDAAICAAGGIGLALAAVGGTLAVAGRRRQTMPRELAP